MKLEIKGYMMITFQGKTLLDQLVFICYLNL